MQFQQFPQRRPLSRGVAPRDPNRFLVQRGRLVKLHVNLAELLMSALARLFVRLTGTISDRELLPPPRQPVRRVSEPCYLGGAVCERYTDPDEQAPDFWVCSGPPAGALEGELVTRRAERNGRLVYYISERRPTAQYSRARP